MRSFRNAARWVPWSSLRARSRRQTRSVSLSANDRSTRHDDNARRYERQTLYDRIAKSYCSADTRWRDRDSNPGHHDFQKAPKTRSRVRICRTSTGNARAAWSMQIAAICARFQADWDGRSLSRPNQAARSGATREQPRGSGFAPRRVAAGASGRGGVVGRRSLGVGGYQLDAFSAGQCRFEGDAHGGHEPEGVLGCRVRCLGSQQSAHA